MSHVEKDRSAPRPDPAQLWIDPVIAVVHLDIGEGGVDGAPDGLQEGFHYPLHIHLPDDSQAFAVAFFRGLCGLAMNLFVVADRQPGGEGAV